MERELHRLKEHLVMVEEQSVIEAREAEERETRLLQKVRKSEEKGEEERNDIGTNIGSYSICYYY